MTSNITRQIFSSSTHCDLKNNVNFIQMLLFKAQENNKIIDKI